MPSSLAVDCCADRNDQQPHLGYIIIIWVADFKMQVLIESKVVVVYQVAQVILMMLKLRSTELLLPRP